MKRLLNVLLLLVVARTASSQKLPTQIERQPDGITINYFNYQDTTDINHGCTVFIGLNIKALFPNIAVKRIDISDSRPATEILQNALTFEFIDTLQRCCTEQGCPDTNHGYMLMKKVGAKYEFIYIDMKYVGIDKCGMPSLLAIISAFESICSHHH